MSKCFICLKNISNNISSKFILSYVQRWCHVLKVPSNINIELHDLGAFSPRLNRTEYIDMCELTLIDYILIFVTCIKLSKRNVNALVLLKWFVFRNFALGDREEATQMIFSFEESQSYLKMRQTKGKWEIINYYFFKNWVCRAESVGMGAA